jgi:cytoskeletal protein RodZ
MKRLSRHTVVVIVVALLSSFGGMGLAVVAFGQDAQSTDATVPLGDYTATTPATATSTAPLSSYTTATTPTSTATVPAATTPTTATGQSSPTSTQQSAGGTKPATTTKAPSTNRSQPSRVTRTGPTRLAFTGGEPIVFGTLGVALMLAGLGLHLRRRRAPHLQA